MVNFCTLGGCTYPQRTLLWAQEAAGSLGLSEKYFLFPWLGYYANKALERDIYCCLLSHSPVSLASTRGETVLTWLKEKLQRGLAVQTLNVMEESMA